MGDTPEPVVFRDGAGKGFGDRLNWLRAWHHMLTGDRVTQAWLADRVGRALGEHYTGSTVGGWVHNLWVPDTRVIASIADVFRCDPGWLAFGAKTKAPNPEQERAERERMDGAAKVAEVVHRELERLRPNTVPLPPRDENEHPAPPVVGRRRQPRSA